MRVSGYRSSSSAEGGSNSSPRDSEPSPAAAASAKAIHSHVRHFSMPQTVYPTKKAARRRPCTRRASPAGLRDWMERADALLVRKNVGRTQHRTKTDVVVAVVGVIPVAIERMLRTKDPAMYLKIVVSLCPREVIAQREWAAEVNTAEITDEELAQYINYRQRQKFVEDILKSIG
jgi:hypothetical protein